MYSNSRWPSTPDFYLRHGENRERRAWIRGYSNPTASTAAYVSRQFYVSRFSQLVRSTRLLTRILLFSLKTTSESNLKLFLTVWVSTGVYTRTPLNSKPTYAYTVALTRMQCMYGVLPISRSLPLSHYMWSWPLLWCEASSVSSKCR